MNKKSSLKSQPHTMSDNPRRFQDHPLKTVGGVVFVPFKDLNFRGFL